MNLNANCLSGYSNRAAGIEKLRNVNERERKGLRICYRGLSQDASTL